jgi:hypothetical protein
MNLRFLCKLCVASFLFLSFQSHAQDIFLIDGKPCPLEGNAKRNSDRQLNRLKNRYKFPEPDDFIAQFTWQTLTSGDDDRSNFRVEKAAKLQGYLLLVKRAGKETCNCNSKTAEFVDFHLVLTPNKLQTEAHYRVVTEVTARMRTQMKAQGIDWSYETLKKMQGKIVEIEGWLFYDYRHGEQASNIRPMGESTRATVWEIHPVTKITLIR